MRLEDAARDMRASLLCLQGGLDPLVDNTEAEHLVALRGPHAATLVCWPEGVHCLYNHALERNAVLVDWLARALA
jgi:alpha-beta hydrolase superfamily lysophospholipase